MRIGAPTRAPRERISANWGLLLGGIVVGFILARTDVADAASESESGARSAMSVELDPTTRDLLALERELERRGF